MNGLPSTPPASGWLSGPMWAAWATLAALLAGACPAPAADPPAPVAVQERKNIAYRDLEKGELFPLGNLLDLYLPEDVPDFPVVVLVHGGAWVSGDKVLDFIPDVARCLARQGIGVVAPNYRLSPWFKYPANVEDVAAAVAWTHRHIGEHGGCAERIILFGHSAGGHLASLLTTDDHYLARVGLGRQHIRGVVSISGVYELSDVSVRTLLLNPTTILDFTFTANPFTLVFGNDPEELRGASPLAHVREDLPPFLLLYAEHDLPTLGEMAVRFDAALRAKGCDVQLEKVGGRSHATVLWKARKADDPVARAVVEFVRKNARPRQE
jgi:acetyl esterase/lipase